MNSYSVFDAERIAQAAVPARQADAAADRVEQPLLLLRRDLSHRARLDDQRQTLHLLGVEIGVERIGDLDVETLLPSQGAKMSTHCFGWWPSQPPQTMSTFFFGAGDCAVGAGDDESRTAAEPSRRLSRHAERANGCDAVRARHGSLLLPVRGSRCCDSAPDARDPAARSAAWPACALYGGRALCAGRAGQLLVVLHQDAVVKHRDRAGRTTAPFSSNRGAWNTMS